MIVKMNTRVNQLNFDAKNTLVVSFHYSYDLVDDVVQGGTPLTQYNETVYVNETEGAAMYKMVVEDVVAKLSQEIASDDLAKYALPMPSLP